MSLDKYISDLLYRYDCVIVPGFGGFIANKVSAKNISSQHKFIPPTKEIAFNSNLNKNDGLLANYIKRSKKISYSHAVDIISNSIEEWNLELEKDNTFEIKKVGSFKLSEGNNLVFTSDDNVNYLTDSYGLSKFTAIEVGRDNIIKEKVKTLSEVRSVPTVNIGRKIVRYAAILIPLLALGTLSYYHKDNTVFNSASVGVSPKVIEKGIVISDSVNSKDTKVIKAIEKKAAIVEKEVAEKPIVKEVVYRYHVISGAFSKESNAGRKIKALKQKGIDSELIGRTNSGLYLVAYKSFENIAEAKIYLKKIKQKTNNSSWILKKTFK